MSKRKVFISWSKRPADDVALGLKALLLHMFDNVDPWVSSDGIEAGSLGVSEIHRRLADTTFGILIVTTQNQREPWLSYEAGALAKTVGVEGTQTQVVPLLVDLESPGQLDAGPIANLQSVVADEVGVLELVRSIGRAVEVEGAALSSRWAHGWAEFETVLSSARGTLTSDTPPAAPRSAEAMLEELVTLMRNQPRSKVMPVITPDSDAAINDLVFGRLNLLVRALRDVKNAAAIFGISQDKRGNWIAEVKTERRVAPGMLQALLESVQNQMPDGPLVLVTLSDDGKWSQRVVL